jgi:hypothetical protein
MHWQIAFTLEQLMHQQRRPLSVLRNLLLGAKIKNLKIINNHPNIGVGVNLLDPIRRRYKGEQHQDICKRIAWHNSAPCRHGSSAHTSHNNPTRHAVKSNNPAQQTKIKAMDARLFN